MQGKKTQHGIYRIIHVDSERCYVGQTGRKDGLAGRWTREKADLRGGTQFNGCATHPLLRAWNKYGEDAFAFEILEAVDIAGMTADEIKTILTIREQWWMDNTNSVYNIAPAAGSQLGYEHTPETCAIISETHRALWASPEYRDKRKEISESPEYRAQISESVRALWEDPEYRSRMSDAHRGQRTSLGKKRTPEQNAANSEARKLYYLSHPGPMTGRRHTAESNAKNSESAKRRWAARKASTS